MNFDLTEEQKMLVQSLERTLAKSFTFEDYRAQVAAKTTHTPEMWESLSELGIMAMPLPESAGGFDGNHVDVMCVCTELGRRLITEPYVGSAVIAAYIFEAVGGDIADEKLPLIATGEAQFAAGFYEPGHRHNPLAVTTSATKTGDGYTLTGHKAVALGGDSADALIVSASLDGKPALFLLDATANGVDLRKYQLQDGRGAADIILEGANATLLAADASDLIVAAVDRAAAALVADTLGAMEEVSNMTQDYLRTRTQFGRPIGSFQVLAHRMVDLLIEFEQSKSIAMEAAVNARTDDAVTRKKAISAAKSKIGKASRKFAQDCIQMHGGIGMTDEYALGAYVKRMLVNEILFGDADYHLSRYASL